MGTERGQSRYYYFYYIAEVLWNSSLKQPAAKQKKTKQPKLQNSASPSLLSQTGTTLCHKTLLQQAFGAQSPSCGRPFAEAEGLARAIFACKSLPLKPLHSSI